MQWCDSSCWKGCGATTKMKQLLVLIGACVASQPSLAAEVEYRTGGAAFSNAWHAFYVGADHEPDIDDPLIEVGSAMVPAICEAIAHSNMARRRYAISALDHIGDRRALDGDIGDLAKLIQANAGNFKSELGHELSDCGQLWFLPTRNITNCR